MHPSSRYDMLRERYFSSLVPLGFELAQQRKKSTIFRKNIQNTSFDFIFVDESGDGVDTGYLAPSIAVVRAGASLKVREIPFESILFFLPNQILPQFQHACGFSAR